MFWADDIADQIEKRFAKEINKGDSLIIRDEKTLSGRVHVGSLRGIVIHGILSQILNERGIKNRFLFELNDNDPMDGLPVYVDEKKFRAHMGKPLFAVPGIKDTDKNFPSAFADELKEAVEPMGLPIEWYFLRPLYLEGKFNDAICDALNNAEQIRKIYKEVSGGEKPSDWYPLNVICPVCGKIGTTKVTGWDGKNVTFECKKNYVKWAEGCGHKGEMNPFDGNATLPWKVEWAAKWKILNVKIEAAGKDHYASGGSRDVCARISEEIFNYKEPFGFLYEWLNIQGKGMSSSGGIGSSAKETADLLPPKLLKFLMIRKEQNQSIDFDPMGRTIPNLFDEYDRCADHYFKRHPEPYEGFARAFAMAQINTKEEPKDIWEMRFQALSFVVQMPHLNVEEQAEKLKGSKLSKDEKDALHERAEYVERWIKSYAPAEFKFIIQTDLPKDFSLNENQKKAYMDLIDSLNKLKEWTGEEVHHAIHGIKESSGLPPKEIFQPLYLIFLNRTSGPQIGWFLSTFSKKDVLRRLQNAVK
jgi:lysyl-tRNA synthetase class 1